MASAVWPVRRVENEQWPDKQAHVRPGMRSGRRGPLAPRQLRAAVADDLLDLYNDIWSEGRTLTRTQFLKELNLDGITTESYGGVTVCYTDGGMFRGHHICVRINDQGIRSAGIEG